MGFGNTVVKILAGFFSLIVIDQAVAFPDQIRHNYVNCSSCHVSPTGGGLLTAYGRSMSKELLSTWGKEREEEFLHGLLPEGALGERVLIGGNVRSIQTHRESPERKVGRAFLMQASTDIGVILGKFVAVMTIGQADAKSRSIRPISPEFYLLYNVTDELAIRGGRFLPVFGLRVPYHTLATRSELGLGIGAQRDGVESVLSGENWNLGLSATRTPQGPVTESTRESLVTAQINRHLMNSLRVGVSALKGKSEQSDREALSLHGVFGFTKRLALLSESAFQKTRSTTGRETNGLFRMNQILFEVSRGWNVYVLEDFAKSDVSDESTLVHALGPGFRFHPRPHFEIDGVFTKKKTVASADRWDDSAWMVLHYYF